MSTRPVVGFILTILLLLLISPAVEAGTVSVTVVNQSDYPWLTKGVYADYFGNQEGYVLPNGTLTLSGLTRVSFGFSSRSGNTTLGWTMLNRTGDVAWIQITYHASGCDSSQSQYEVYFKNNFTLPLQCIKIDFRSSLTVEVNVTSREAYADGQPAGILNFWAPPLLDDQPAYVGTAIVGGVLHDLVANASGPITSSSHALILGANGGPLTINESGSTYGGPFTYYTLAQTTFGTGPDSTFGWVKSEMVVMNGTPSFSPKVSPSGTYNYYSGLALTLSQPEYPVPQTVCGVDRGQPVDCSYTTYSTTLGSYFRSTGGELYLVATNIPLVPSQTPAGSASPGVPLLPVAGVVVVAAAITGFVAFWIRKGRRDVAGPGAQVESKVPPAG